MFNPHTDKNVNTKCKFTVKKKKKGHYFWSGSSDFLESCCHSEAVREPVEIKQ